MVPAPSPTAAQTERIGLHPLHDDQGLGLSDQRVPAVRGGPAARPVRAQHLLQASAVLLHERLQALGAPLAFLGAHRCSARRLELAVRPWRKLCIGGGASCSAWRIHPIQQLASAVTGQVDQGAGEVAEPRDVRAGGADLEELLLLLVGQCLAGPHDPAGDLVRARGVRPGPARCALPAGQPGTCTTGRLPR